MSYYTEWTSLRSSAPALSIRDVDISLSGPLIEQPSFLSFLATAQMLEIPILATTWDAGSSQAGLGGTSIIHSADVDMMTLFAYKRIHEISKRNMTETQLMRILVGEIAVSCHRAIRQNPHITQLRGICWDVSADDDKPWPVLIFERSNSGDLYNWIEQAAKLWHPPGLTERIRYCVEVGTAIAAMHSINIVHGDIKPENVLMFNQSNKPVIAKVADFGYSCRFTTERSRLKLPISRPWNAPEHTRSSREWTFKQAVKTDIFSYGMLCLWTLYHDYFRDVCTDDDSRYGISTVKDDLRPLSRRLVTEDPNLTVNQRRSLEEFFSSCLHDDPEQRESSMLKLLQKLNTEQLVGNLAPAKDSEKLLEALASDFKVEKSIQDMYCSDYRVRSYIYKAVSSNYQKQPAFALQLALCYTVGFGVVRDESKARDILAQHNIAPQLLYDLTSQCLEKTMTHPSTSLHKLWRISYVSCVDLSYLYLRQHKLKPAETQLLQEIEDLEAALGRDTVLATVLETELGSIYEVQGRFQEAQDIQEQIVERNKRLFGENHLDTLASIARLASILYNRGLWEDARRLQVQTLEQAKKLYGSGNFEILSASCGLALTYIRQGQWLKAGETINQIGDFSRGEVSASHPLMVPYHTCGVQSVLWEFQFQGVQRMFEVFLKYLSSSVLGDDHPAMLAWPALQATCLAKHEKWEEAELIEVQLLEKRERLLGHNHPDTLQTMRSLATTLMHRGRLDDAEKLQAHAVVIQSDILGRDHPDTLASFTSLASIYLAQSRWKDAVELEIENIRLKQVKLGECHHETLVSMINLVCAYRNQGRIEEATEEKKQIMERCEKSWMKVPYDAWIDLTNLSVIMSQRGWWEEAEGIQRQLVDMSVREFGECESLTFTSKSVLASSLWRRGQWDAAEDLQTQAVAIGRENPWDEHPALLDCMDNLQEMKAGLHKGVQRT